LELVRDGENGLVVAPMPESLAGAFARLMESSQDAERLGSAAAATVAQMTWEAAVKKLVIV
jgi:glycosyltransferase involved in cell wall biosynthesis